LSFFASLQHSVATGQTFETSGYYLLYLFLIQRSDS
jgi:hypothetical protein